MPRVRPTRPTDTAAAARGVRDRLLDAAIAILRESGLQRLTQVEVAERTGVRQSHLTYYFPSRDDLLDAVTSRAVEGIAARVRQAMGVSGGSGSSLPLDRLAAAVADLEHMRMFVGLLVEADGEPALRAMLVRGTEQVEAALAEALGGETALERARLALAAVWGLGLYHFLMRPPPRSRLTRPYLAWVASAARSRNTDPDK
ncbi:MAG TPA: TetR/AcrR family transcriptional regulator [Gemmatimonadales bacterium]